MARTDIDDKKDWIIAQLEAGIARHTLHQALGCKPDTLNVRLKVWGVSHLKNQSGKGRPKYGARKSVYAYLGADAPYTSAHRLKGYLIRDGLKKAMCEVCGITEWLGKPAPLELDHMNGNRFDNRLENLCIKCPNCHAMAPTNGGKNIGAYKKQA